MYITMHCGATYENFFFDTLTFSKLSNFTEKSFYLCVHNDNPVDMAYAHVLMNLNMYWCSLYIFWAKINGEFLKDSTGVNVRSLTKTKQMSYIFLTFT